MIEAVTVSVPLYKFYKNTKKAHPNSWSYVEDELFIPMRPELRKDIGDNVNPTDIVTIYNLLIKNMYNIYLTCSSYNPSFNKIINLRQ